jgi:hypothetical protein
MEEKEETEKDFQRFEMKWCLGPESNRYGAKHRGILRAKTTVFLTP